MRWRWLSIVAQVYPAVRAVMPPVNTTYRTLSVTIRVTLWGLIRTIDTVYSINLVDSVDMRVVPLGDQTLWPSQSAVLPNKSVLLQEMRSIVHHHVSVTAANTERVDGHPAQPLLWPGCRLGWKLQMPRVLDLRIDLFEPDVWRNDTPFECENALDDGRNSSSTLEVSNVALQRAHIQRLVW